MKIKKGVKILGSILGAAAVSMSVVCCYAPAPSIDDKDNTNDSISIQASIDSDNIILDNVDIDNR